MDGATRMMLGMLFSSIGMGYFVYGKKQMRAMAFVAGFGLMLFPYFVANIWLFLLIGIALMALPFIVKF